MRKQSRQSCARAHLPGITRTRTQTCAENVSPRSIHSFFSAYTPRAPYLIVGVRNICATHARAHQRTSRRDVKQPHRRAPTTREYNARAPYLVRVECLATLRVRVEALERRGDVALADGDARRHGGACHDLATGRRERARREDAVERADRRAVVRNVPPAPLHARVRWHERQKREAR